MSTTLPASGVTFSRVAIALGSSVPPPGLIARGELVVVVPPLRFLVHRRVGDAAQPPDELPVGGDRRGGDAAAGGGAPPRGGAPMNGITWRGKRGIGQPTQSPPPSGPPPMPAIHPRFGTLQL